MWARAARCALIGLGLTTAVFVEAIERPVHAIGKAAVFVDRVTGDLDFKAKLSSVSLRFGENIIIVDPSPDISMGCADTYFLQCLGIQIEGFKICWNISSIDSNPRTDFVYRSLGRGFATILPNRLECPFYYKLCSFIRSPDSVNSFTVNESPFSCNQGFFAKGNLVNGGCGGLFGSGDRARQIRSLLISYSSQFGGSLNNPAVAL
jgi:hypothetical protein